MYTKMSKNRYNNFIRTFYLINFLYLHLSAKIITYYYLIVNYICQTKVCEYYCVTLFTHNGFPLQLPNFALDTFSSIRNTRLERDGIFKCVAILRLLMGY